MEHSVLFTPATIGPLTLRNRTIRAAAFEGMCFENKPSELLHNYHQAVAAGGIGMTTLAYAAVCPSGLSFSHQLLMSNENRNALKNITDAIHKEGAAASVQLGHCGNMSKKKVAGQMPLSPSGGLNIYSPTWSKKMDENDIRFVVNAFADAVKLARNSGFDAVEIHAGHGYLISQFLSPYTNKRKDEYGGSLENRMKFMKMVIESVMEAAGSDIAVIVKTNLRDGFKGGLEIDDCLTVAKTLENMGVHALVLSGGFVSKAPMYVMRGAMPITSLTHYMESLWLKYSIKMFGKLMIPTVPFTETYFLEDAIRFRKNLKLPLIYVGGIVSRQKADEVLAHGFEFVSMARALVHDTDFVNKMKENPEAKSACCAANYCIARMYSREMACHQHIPDLPDSILHELKKQ